MALNPATPATAIAHVLDLVDLVLVMTVNPGFGGQAYLPTMEPKIADVRRMVAAAGLDDVIDIEVDGGIGPDTVAGAARAGANVLVAGSALFRDPEGLEQRRRRAARRLATPPPAALTAAATLDTPSVRSAAWRSTSPTPRHGAPALDALAEAVRAGKGGDPLAQVAVLVPTNTAGVMARRALGRRGGAAAIDVLTLFRLAELLGSPSLHAEGRNPVSTPVVDLAVKRVIHEMPGLYAGVNHHPSTVVALRDLYRELRAAGPGSLTALARTPGARAGRVAAEVARLLAADWYDEGDLLVEGSGAGPGRAARPAQRIVVHLPQRLRPLEATCSPPSPSAALELSSG